MTATLSLGAELRAAWKAHVARVLADRGDEDRLHGSDLHSCDFALWQRLRGVEQLPNDDGSFGNFERGHAYEARAHEALVAHYVARGFSVTRGEEIEYDGIVGHLDFAIYEADKDAPCAIVDATMTASKTTEWSYAHALKTAFYAVAKGGVPFAEWVFRIGFGGVILGSEVHEFRLDDHLAGGLTWREHVAAAIAEKQLIAASPIEPEARPPIDPLDDEEESWRCGKPGSGKSYCRARCELNARGVA